jgi:hypothetical protein
MLKKTLLAASLSLAACAALANDPISVNDPHVRLVPPTAENTGVFMVIQNKGEKDVRLVSASSPASKVVELHTVVKEGEVMKMRPVKDIEVKAKGETVLKPGSYHVMLIGLNQPLEEGVQVPVTLGFDDGSSKTLQAPVRRIMAPMPPK